MLRVAAAALLLLASPAAHSGEGCKALDGTYRNESEGSTKRKEFLDEFVRMRDGGRDPKLFRRDGTGKSAVIKHFAATATLANDGKVLQISYHDAGGMFLARHPADYPYEWQCKGSRFEWEHTGLSGLGDNVSEMHTLVTLTRLDSGDLQMVEERTDSRKKGAPSRTEILFRGVPTPAK
ncbi:hypothetical protein DSM104443_02590 [Usitatibacter rugosus]|uniref:Uncharacterized protein n=1 Tax=Usitatibacter rugosus TaxID=2732067 RepID=A0A6M4GWZ4_9PROT|nr:hypothetical protein [Usitatibacter rugosus]QJR11512.1 hypothetical protein DSM104443_02590 [Usitatibacter rugosus]